MILVLCPILAVLAGCAEVGSVEALQQRVISDADPDQVLTAAAAILQREFGRVKVDRAARRITTSPVEYTTERESGTARDLYRGRTIMRRSALFSVGRSGGATVARLRVDVERRDTERQAMFMPRTHRLSDNPGQETPIEADAATSQEQNTVWTRVRRDHRLERTLLDELRDYFARIAGETPALPSAGPPTEQATETAPGGETRD
jgi:hypothetical protein